MGKGGEKLCSNRVSWWESVALKRAGGSSYKPEVEETEFLMFKR